MGPRRLRIPAGILSLVLLLIEGFVPSTVVLSRELPATDRHDSHEERVALTPEQIAEFGIERSTAGPAVIRTTVEVPGEIRANADRLAHIVPRYSGIVTAVGADIGDRVSEGQVLAVVEGDDSLAPFDVVTLIAGTVIEKHITLGEAVGRESPSFVIADLSSVWLDLTVYQRDLDRIDVGQSVEVFVGHTARDRGTIAYVTPVVDERTRTATARVVLDNREGLWRPGMFVTGRVVVDETNVPVAITRESLHSLHGETVVFVETPEGFVPHPVVVGRVDAAHAEVVSGLETGTAYASAGAFTLKAELGKGSFGDGHDH